MSRIAIHDMQFYSQHGCFEEERAIGTRFSVDVAFETDTTRAQRTDDIEDTVNYLSVYQVVKEQMAQPSHLLENVADRIGNALLLHFPAIEKVDVAVHKLNPPLGGEMRSVSVSLSFSR